MDDLFLARRELLVDRQQLRACLGGLCQRFEAAFVPRRSRVELERAHFAKLPQQLEARIGDLDAVVELCDACRQLELGLRRLRAPRVLLADRRAHKVALLAPDVDVVVRVDAHQPGPIPRPVRADRRVVRRIRAEETVTRDPLAIGFRQRGHLQTGPRLDQFDLRVCLPDALVRDGERRRMGERQVDQRIELRIVILLPPTRRRPAFVREMDVVGEADLLRRDHRGGRIVVVDDRARGEQRQRKRREPVIEPSCGGSRDQSYGRHARQAPQAQ